MLERLTAYYGQAPYEISEFVNKKILGYTQHDKDCLYNYILNTCPKDNGFPSFKDIQDAFSRNPPSSGDGKKHACCVCSECGSRYDYRMMFCPKCWSKGKQVSDHAVLVKEEEIPGVVKYNKLFVGFENDPKDPSCFSCENKDMSFCKNFGNPKWQCHDFHECGCARCCVVHKHYAEKNMK